ncbi:hypothetical protein [Massilia eurypsychrophila]|uniref:hypothetical protein n=1 Tax=Massilia eurypsychrophila TaxID=1485217 RepID=UPI000C186DB4|nr:hypothetical protein [Massilia eurypsychrophila]
MAALTQGQIDAMAQLLRAKGMTAADYTANSPQNMAYSDSQLQQMMSSSEGAYDPAQFKKIFDQRMQASSTPGGMAQLAEQDRAGGITGAQNSVDWWNENPNGVESNLDKFMGFAIPAVAGGIFGGGLLNAFGGAGAAASSAGSSGAAAGYGSAGNLLSAAELGSLSIPSAIGELGFLGGVQSGGALAAAGAGTAGLAAASGAGATGAGTAGATAAGVGGTGAAGATAGGTAATGGGLLSGLGTAKNIVGIGSAVGGLLGASGAGGSSSAGNQTITTKSEMDPRIAGMLFGENGQQGLLSQYQALGQQPQNPLLKQYGDANLGYLGNAGADMGAMRNAATGLLGGQQAPQAQAAQSLGAQGQAAQQSSMAYNVGNMVNAPSQNGMNLSGSYDKFINGDAGANPYLNKALQGSMDQSRNVFNQMQGDARSGLDSALGSIRSNSVLSGQYGGSRQGIAEGNAIGDFAKAQQQTINQFGQNNTNAAVGAQASAFNQGQDRALAATQGLGAQQYGVASQNAATKNAAEFANVGATNNMYAQNTANQQQMGLANLATQQQTNQNNAGFQQQTNLANLGATQNQSQLNMSGISQGSGILGGLLGTAAGAGQNQDSYALNQAGKVNGLLSPYLGQVPGSRTESSPLYENKAGNILGGIAGGAALAKQFGGLLDSWNKPGGSAGGGMTSALQDNPFGYGT